MKDVFELATRYIVPSIRRHLARSMSLSTEGGYSKARGRISNIIVEMSARMTMYPHHLTRLLRKMTLEEIEDRIEVAEKAK